MVDQSPWDPPIDAIPSPREPILGRLLKRWQKFRKEQVKT
jgi:hypothetical protein